VTERVRHRNAQYADLGGPAGHDAAVVVDEPCDEIGVTTKEGSQMDLSMLAYWKIRPRLLGVPGVPMSQSGAAVKCFKSRSIPSAEQLA